MSIPVDLDKLADAVTDFDAGYLLTVSPEGKVKAVTVEPVVEAALVRIPGGSRGSAANLADNPAVTLVYPPRERHGYTLIVDGVARVVEDGFEMAPDAAVLHRPADHADGPPAPGSCSNDCVRI